MLNYMCRSKLSKLLRHVETLDECDEEAEERLPSFADFA